MTLTTGFWGSSQLDRCIVSCVALGAAADRSISIWRPDLMALGTAHLDGGLALEAGQRIGRPLDHTRVITLGERNLLGRKTSRPRHRGHGRRRVTATQELVVFPRMTRRAVLRRQLRRDHEPVVVIGCLPIRRLMTVETTHALIRMTAHLILVHDRRGHISVARRAPAGRGHLGRAGTLGLERGSSGVHDHGGHDQRRGNQNRE